MVCAVAPLPVADDVAECVAEVALEVAEDAGSDAAELLVEVVPAALEAAADAPAFAGRLRPAHPAASTPAINNDVTSPALGHRAMPMLVQPLSPYGLSAGGSPT